MFNFCFHLEQAFLFVVLQLPYIPYHNGYWIIFEFQDHYDNICKSKTYYEIYFFVSLNACYNFFYRMTIVILINPQHINMASSIFFEFSTYYCLLILIINFKHISWNILIEFFKFISIIISWKFYTVKCKSSIFLYR